MKTRPCCVVCLLFLLLQSILLMIKSGESLVEIPRTSIFYEETEEALILKGQIYKKTNHSNYQILYLKNNSVADSRLMIYDSSFTDVPIGNYILLRGKRNYFERADNPGGFDQALYYVRQNIFGSVKCEEILEVSGTPDEIREFLYRLKTSWNEKLLTCMGKKNGGILSAMILGEKSEMDAEVKELYQNQGISHILAISGLHISFIGLGIYKFIRKTGVPFWCSGIFSMGILTVYVLMIGWSVSAVRAYVMLLLKIGADITGRVYDMLTAAMLGAALTVGYQPLYLTDGGFYLSYGAILGIAVLLPALEQCFPRRCKWMSGCYASAAIQCMLIPVTLWFFYVFPTYSFLVNLLVLPLTGPVLGMGFAGSFLYLISPKGGSFCLKGCGLILEFFEGMCRMGNKLPMSRLVFGQPKWWELVFYYGILAVVLYVILILQKKRKIIWLSLGIAIGVMAYRPRGAVQITMLDVGQGDGICIQGPAGGNFFIDGGSSDERQVGQYCIEPFLKYQGIGTLDYVFLSHGDTDHYSGIEELLGRQETGIRIRNLVLPVNYKKDEALTDLAVTAVEAGVRVLVMKSGDQLQDGKMQISCLQPSGQESLTGNAGSMVLDITYGEFAMLCTGDLEGMGEELLLQNLKGRDYDVLKVAHHGSKNSTSEVFLKQTTPEIALISAGEDNSYGHPHAELLSRLKHAGCKVYNTQENGAIRMQTDGNSLTIW